MTPQEYDTGDRPVFVGALRRLGVCSATNQRNPFERVVWNYSIAALGQRFRIGVLPIDPKGVAENENIERVFLHFARFRVAFLAGLCASVCAGLAFASRCNTAVNGTASSSYSDKSIGLDFFVFMVV